MDAWLAQDDIRKLWSAYQTAPKSDKPAVFMKLIQSQRALMLKAPQVNVMRHEQRRFEQELNEFIKQELRSYPTSRPLTPTEMDILIDRITERVKPQMEKELNEQVLAAFKRGHQTAMGEFQLASAPLSPFHIEAIRRQTSAPVVLEALEKIGNGVRDKLVGIVEEEYRKGQLSPQRLTIRLIDEAGWENRHAIELVASTESWKAFTEGRMLGYLDAERRLGEKFLYQFGTDADGKTCKTCTHIMEATMHGVPMNEMRQAIIDAAAIHNPNWDPIAGGGWPMPHIRCRHVIYRKVNRGQQ